MSADDDVETRGGRIQVERMQIMKNVEKNFARFGNGCFWQRLSPFTLVHVSAHGDDGSKLAQRCENLRLAHIACVKNQLGSAKRLQRLRAQQAVSVRDQPNPRR